MDSGDFVLEWLRIPREMRLQLVEEALEREEGGDEKAPERGGDDSPFEPNDAGVYLLSVRKLTTGPTSGYTVEDSHGTMVSCDRLYVNDSYFSVTDEAETEADDVEVYQTETGNHTVVNLLYDRRDGGGE